MWVRGCFDQCVQATVRHTGQLQAFGSDRSKLAAELDHVRARSVDLESANREVSRRLERAVDSIRTVLVAQER